MILCLTNFSAAAQSNLWTCNFTTNTWFSEWVNEGVPSINQGIIFGNSNISRIDDATAPGGGFLRISFPQGSYAKSGSPPAPVGGCQFYGAVLHAHHGTARDALTLKYALRFPTNFNPTNVNFVRGGKLPGLYGGLGNTGTNTPNGTDGFTTRFMWRTGGAGEAFAGRLLAGEVVCDDLRHPFLIANVDHPGATTKSGTRR